MLFFVKLNNLRLGKNDDDTPLLINKNLKFELTYNNITRNSTIYKVEHNLLSIDEYFIFNSDDNIENFEINIKTNDDWDNHLYSENLKINVLDIDNILTLNFKFLDISDNNTLFYEYGYLSSDYFNSIEYEEKLDNEDILDQKVLPEMLNNFNTNHNKKEKIYTLTEFIRDYDYIIYPPIFLYSIFQLIQIYKGLYDI